MSKSDPKHEPKIDPAMKFSRDITGVLSGWEYEPGSINVRKIVGNDGKPKLQMRLDLGLLQMELTGRPDGRRPHGCESLLEFYERQLKKHRARGESAADNPFVLSPRQCQQLREEAVQYYHRYLSLFVLGEFDGVIRDTDRNLRVLDFCRKYASRDHDKYVMEQYRPYITMMNARAQASMHYTAERYRDALDAVRRGLKRIRRFFMRIGQVDAFKHANEVKVLKGFAKEILKKLPVDPVEQLKRELGRAIRAEAYEEAARIRDELTRLGHGGA